MMPLRVGAGGGSADNSSTKRTGASEAIVSCSQSPHIIAAEAKVEVQASMPTTPICGGLRVQGMKSGSSSWSVGSSTAPALAVVATTGVAAPTAMAQQALQLPSKGLSDTPGAADNLAARPAVGSMPGSGGSLRVLGAPLSQAPEGVVLLPESEAPSMIHMRSSRSGDEVIGDSVTLCSAAGMDLAHSKTRPLPPLAQASETTPHSTNSSSPQRVLRSISPQWLGTSGIPLQSGLGRSPLWPSTPHLPPLGRSSSHCGDGTCPDASGDNSIGESTRSIDASLRESVGADSMGSGPTCEALSMLSFWGDLRGDGGEHGSPPKAVVQGEATLVAEADGFAGGGGRKGGGGGRETSLPSLCGHATSTGLLQQPLPLRPQIVEEYSDGGLCSQTSSPELHLPSPLSVGRAKAKPLPTSPTRAQEARHRRLKREGSQKCRAIR